MLWKDSYKLGVEAVDRQHEELFKRLHKFLQVVRGDADKATRQEEIEKTLTFMGEYVVTHFDSEEAIQKKYNYPKRKEHHQIHEEFKTEVGEFAEEFSKNPNDDDLLQEFSGRLLTWLISHVTGEDQKLADYITKGDDK